MARINGVLPLDFGFNGAFKRASVIGGPYDEFPEKGLFGVCVRAEPTSRDFDIKLDVRDFNVPEDDEEVVVVLCEIVDAIYRGEIVYIGCMGGMGRTGLIMSLLAKAVGIAQPVEYVRRMYYSHAVETKDQYAYVQNFDVSEVRRHIRRVAWGQLLGFWSS